MTAETNVAISPEQIAVLVQAGYIPKETPPAQIAVFAQVCKERGLSPAAKEIYLVAYAGRYSTIVGINGLRKLAADTGQFAGCDDVKFNLAADGTFKTAAELIAAGQLPATATATVYRVISGVRCPFTHTAAFKEFAGSGKWQTMPFQMLAKVSESFALRKGFSDRTTGLHIEEEVDSLQGTTVVEVNQEAPARARTIAAVRQKLDTVRMVTEEQENNILLLLADPETPLPRLRDAYAWLLEIEQMETVAANPAEQFKQISPPPSPESPRGIKIALIRANLPKLNLSPAQKADTDAFLNNPLTSIEALDEMAKKIDLKLKTQAVAA